MCTSQPSWGQDTSLSFPDSKPFLLSIPSTMPFTYSTFLFSFSLRHVFPPPDHLISPVLPQFCHSLLPLTNLSIFLQFLFSGFLPSLSPFPYRHPAWSPLFSLTLQCQSLFRPPNRNHFLLSLFPLPLLHSSIVSHSTFYPPSLSVFFLPSFPYHLIIPSYHRPIMPSQTHLSFFPSSLTFHLCPPSSLLPS